MSQNSGTHQNQPPGGDRPASGPKDTPTREQGNHPGSDGPRGDQY